METTYLSGSTLPDQSKIFIKSEISLTDKQEFDMIKRSMLGTLKDTDYIIIGVNELEGRSEAKYINKIDWDGKVEDLKDV